MTKSTETAPELRPDALAAQDAPALRAEVERLRDELASRPSRAEVRMDRPCDWADELRLRADAAERGES